MRAKTWLDPSSLVESSLGRNSYRLSGVYVWRCWGRLRGAYKSLLGETDCEVKGMLGKDTQSGGFDGVWLVFQFAKLDPY